MIIPFQISKNHHDYIKVSDELEIISRSEEPNEFDVYKDGEMLGKLIFRSKVNIKKIIANKKNYKVFALFKNHLLIDIR
jgi:hypothetical protein